MYLRVVLTFLFEPHHRVLLSRFEGQLSEQDLRRQGERVRAFEARAGLMRLILDFTGIETIQVEAPFIAALGSGIPNGAERVLVAPQPEMFGLVRLYSTHVDIAGRTPPRLVRTRAEAYAAFGLGDDAAFEPIDLD